LKDYRSGSCPGKLQCRLAKKAKAARVIHSMKLVADVAARFANGEGVANDGIQQFTQHASVRSKDMPSPGMRLVPRRYLGSGRARHSVHHFRSDDRP